MKKPDFVTKEHLTYLQDFSFGPVAPSSARPFLMRAFPDLSKQQAAEVLSYWLSSPQGML